mgnify:CR=1 FL=1
MYAIVKIQGQQFKVEKDRKLYVHRLNAEEGAAVEFNQILLIDNNKEVKVGTPTIKGASVSAKVLKHVKGDKVSVFKKKRRKGFQKCNGHRQQFSQILVEEINATVKKTRAKKQPKVEEPVVEEETKTEE